MKDSVPKADDEHDAESLCSYELKKQGKEKEKEGKQD